MELMRTKTTRRHALRLFVAAVILIAVLSLRYPSLEYEYDSSPVSVSESVEVHTAAEPDPAECDTSVGEWVPNPDGPYYTNQSCWAIHEHQNCMKYGRPDSDYLKWRWKPYGCDLPVFDPVGFLEMVAGKSLAFVGDSVARNQLQSMVCLLSKVEYPRDVSPTPDGELQSWRYENYNFTLAIYWSSFLVRYEQRAEGGPMNTGLFDLYLDEPDPVWATEIDKFDFVIVSCGHWYSRTAVYHERRQIVGCRYCQIPNITDLPSVYAYRSAIRTALNTIEKRQGFDGLTIMRTFSPSHFEGGLWNQGGNCLRQRPYKTNETVLEGVSLEFYEAQMQEFRAVQRRGRKRFRLMDLTHAMNLRPDGHPSRYGHLPNANVTLYNDCVHWCLPGPIDSWADVLMRILKLERGP